MNLFSPLSQRGLQLRNRIVVSPICQYSAVDGMPGNWHLVHLGSRAVGGAAVVIAEATAVTPRGRISPGDTGLWSDAQTEAWAPIVAFIAAQGAIPAIQLAHAGRKASTQAPWLGGSPLPSEGGGWQPVAPSALAYDSGYSVPEALDTTAIDALVEVFVQAAQRADAAGFGMVELHAAHGYLLHSFLSPLSNHRDDEYGGSLENRLRLPLRIVAAVREVWPESKPLWVRLSATDWAEGGWDIEQSVVLAQSLKLLGVDLIDVSSGGLVPQQEMVTGPGFQAPFAARIRHQAGLATGAVGMITTPEQAQSVITEGSADVVLLAREMMRDPYFPRRAARQLGAQLEVPPQYIRAW